MAGQDKVADDAPVKSRESTWQDTYFPLVLKSRIFPLTKLKAGFHLYIIKDNALKELL
jgi:hypothetical protein